MRLDGEISDIDEIEEEEREESEAEIKARSIGDGLLALTQKLVVGYALTSKKKQSFLQPKLVALARY